MSKLLIYLPFFVCFLLYVLCSPDVTGTKLVIDGIRLLVRHTPDRNRVVIASAAHAWSQQGGNRGTARECPFAKCQIYKREWYMKADLTISRSRKLLYIGLHHLLRWKSHLDCAKKKKKKKMCCATSLTLSSHLIKTEQCCQILLRMSRESPAWPRSSYSCRYMSVYIHKLIWSHAWIAIARGKFSFPAFRGGNFGFFVIHYDSQRFPFISVCFSPHPTTPFPSHVPLIVG
jgi:hypothetical protein